MVLKQEPFVRYNEKKKVDSVVVRFNEEERYWLQDAKRIIEQPKDSTTLKTLALIGYKCIKSPVTEELLSAVFKNKRNNSRLGITESDYKK